MHASLCTGVYIHTESMLHVHTGDCCTFSSSDLSSSLCARSDFSSSFSMALRATISSIDECPSPTS